MKKIYIYLTFLISTVAISQNYNMNATDVITCSGTFYDSGGNGGNYANNQTITKTFCPSTPGAAIRFVFTQFSLEDNADFLYIYDGDSTTSPLLATYTGTDLPLVVQPTAANTSGCITFVFISDGVTISSGWVATISCQVACQSITANLDSTVPAVNSNGVIRVTTNQNITFNGSASFSTTGVGATYTWNFDDGTSATGTSVTHSYPNPGIYRVNLEVRDALDCINSNRIDQFIHVSPEPVINFNSYNTETCPDIPLDITAVVDNFDLPGAYTGTPFVYSCTEPVVGETFLPDGSGASYQTSTLVTCYEPSAVITNVNQLQQVCLNIEHSYLGDLQIELISPNGSSVILKAYPGSGGTFLGDANDDGSTDPGIGFTYCFTPSATTLLINGPTVPVNTFQAGNSIAPGNYMPATSFNALLGSPLNGLWTIKVTDNLAIDNGYIFGWNIDFDPALYPANYTFAPALINQVWSPDATITNTVDNTITIQSNAANTTQTYTFNVTDDTGNTFSAPFDIDILDFPLINPTPPDLFCATCDLNDNNPFVIDASLNYLDYDFTFYLSLQDAIDQTGGISNIYNLPAGTSVQVWVRIEDFLLECPSYNSFLIINPSCDLSLLSPTGTDNQNPCLNSSIQDVVFTTTGGITDVIITNGVLPAGLSGTFDTTTGEYTISGIPIETGSFTVTVSTVGCSTEITHDVTINVIAPPVLNSLTSNNEVCSGQNVEFYLNGTPNAFIDYVLNGNPYTLQLDSTGNYTLVIPTDATSSNQDLILNTIYIGTCSDTLTNTESVIVNITPAVDVLTDVTACDSYVLQPLTVGNYYTGPNGTGTMFNAGDVISTAGVNTFYIYSETGTTPNCFDESSFTVTINTTPAVDVLTDVTACDSYVLQPLTVGNYYTGPNGTGTMFNAGDVISTLGVNTFYIYAETGTTPNCFDESSFTVTINTTPAVDVLTDVTACDSYVLQPLTVGNYYTGPNGTGTMFNAGDVISTAGVNTFYIYSETGTTPNCFDESSFTVTINTTPAVDVLTDVTACDSYVLQPLTVGNYYTGPNGTGTMFNAGDVISTAGVNTFYIYSETGTTPNCFDESSFTVTINTTPAVDVLTDVTACDSYVLQPLTVGNYYTGPNGTGTMFNAGDVISTAGVNTFYIYSETGTTPNCFDESSFTVTINTTPVVDVLTDVTACDSYVLQPLTVGNYYTGPNGTGTMFNAGDVISTAGVNTFYIYSETGTTPNCFDESSFTVTINTTPAVDVLTNVTACDSYVLQSLTVGNYYTGPNGTGTMFNAGDVISTAGVNTFYIYSETGTTPNCFDESSFTVTINTTPAVDVLTNVTACDSYVLQPLTVGNYYTGPNGTGTMFNAGDVISTLGVNTFYIYSETGTTPNCFDESSFTVTINTTPAVDVLTDVTACDSYVLQPLTVGNYYTGPNGTGTMFNAGDVISTAGVNTFYIYSETGTTPNCFDESSFTVTINTTPAVDVLTNVTACDSYVLQSLTVGNYYTGPNGTGTMFNAGDVISTAGVNTFYIYSETGTTPNCFDESSFTVTINTTPAVDVLTNVTACDSYVLQPLTVGNYYTGPNGTGTMFNAGDVISTLGVNTFYIYSETGTTPNCFDESSFTVTINTTPAVDVLTDVTACDSYVLQPLTVGNYYTGPNGTGTMFNAGDVISTAGVNTFYIYSETGTTPNCFDESSFTVTINTTPVVDVLTDVTACDSYVLQPLTVGNYYTGPNGTGTMFNAGDVISTAGVNTFYIYSETGTTPNCFDESSFTVTINTTPAVDVLTDVTACDSYVLQPLTVGNYYTGPNGTGTMFNAGDVISTAGVNTFYIYSETGTTPNCFDESSFTVTINTTPVVDVLTDVTACDSYVLQPLTVGNYYTGPNGTGTMFNAGDVISTLGVNTFYIYSETGTTPNCFDESSFTVTINTTPAVDVLTDVTACDSYVLQPLTVGNYYTGPNGTGTMFNAGDVISTAGVNTFYIYSETGTTPNCFDESSFTVTINTTPTVSIDVDSNAVCLNGTTSLTFTGTPNATVYFTDGINNYDVELDGSGNGVYPTPNLTVATTYTLTSVSSNTTPACSQALADSETITISPTPTADATYTSTICSGSMTDIVVALGNTTTYTWTATVTNIDGSYNQSGDETDINQVATLSGSGLQVGTINIQIVPTLSGSSCAGVPEYVTITVNPIPVINDIVYGDLSVCSSDTTQNIHLEIDGDPTGVQYNWQAFLNGVVVVSGGTSGTTTSDIDLTVEVTNLTQSGDLYFEITPVLNGCTGLMVTTSTFTVTPIPGSVLASGSSVSICSGTLVDDTVLDIQLGYPVLANTTVEWIVQDSQGVDGANAGSATSAPFTIMDTLTTTGNVQGYVIYRVWTISENGCRGEYTDFMIYVNPNPTPVLTDGAICIQDGHVYQTYWLNAGDFSGGTYSFEWYMEDTAGDVLVDVTTGSTLEVDMVGNYYVVVTNEDPTLTTNCTGTSNTVSIIETNPATSFTTIVTDAFTNNATVVVDVPNGTGTMLFSIDEGAFQESEIFTNVSAGEHTITVIDSQGCTYLVDTVMVIDYPKYFTPNGDGINDTWNIVGLEQENAKLYIFDRYGKLVKQISTLEASNGNGWDGTYNGKPLPATDYWFSLQYEENGVAKEFKAHFTLTR